MEDLVMAETVTKLPVKREKAPGFTSTLEAWQPLETLHQEIDKLFDDFSRGSWRPFSRSLFAVEPFWRGEPKWVTAPVVDVVESEKAFEITAELPGMDEKDIEVKVVDGSLSIKGEKQEEKEEKKKEYYLRERRFGSFERSFELPDSVDADKIEAAFKKGVLTVTLPKKAEAQTPAKKIEVKAA
jgi:HSP20 family protein